jgi:hypothetical protein
MPTAAAPLVIDPAGTITCDVTSPVLLQSHFEASSVTWDVTVDAVAKGGNTSIDGPHTASLSKSLSKEYKYQLGIKRVPLNSSDAGTAGVTTAGEWSAFTTPPCPFASQACLHMHRF